ASSRAARASACRRCGPSSGPDVSERLLELAAEGPRAWPKIAWPAAELAAELERRGLTDLLPERVAEVYLASAAARGDAAAVAAFDERYGKDLVVFASKARLPDDLVEEVVQDVRAHLLVGRTDRPAQLVQFAGRGELRSWLQVTTVRQAILTAKR